MEQTKKGRKAVFEKIISTVDINTGEVINEKKEVILPSEREPDFIKLYIDCVCAFNGLNKALSPILIAFCSYMTWANDSHEGQIIFMNSYTKEQVSNKLGISVKRVNQALTDIVKADIFRKIEGKRGVYKVNPYIIAKGKWTDVKALRANFDFVNKTIEPIIEEKEDSECEH